MNSSRYKNSQFKHLCFLVGSNPDELTSLLENIDNLYDEWPEKKKDKLTQEIKRYKDGTIKTRMIRPSLRRLKSIQTAIKNNILAKIPLPENIYGGVKGKSNILNAKPHQGHKFIFCTDLLEFYPTITSNQVYQAFLKNGFSPDMSHWLTRLTTIKHELPQGTPTSTHLANVVMLELDKNLIPFCKEHSITYTRYVDDLTFSSSQDFKPLLNDILRLIKSHGFKISYRKTSYKGSQIITGIKVLNNYIDAPQNIKEKSKAERLMNKKSQPLTTYIKNIRKTNNKIGSR